MPWAISFIGPHNAGKTTLLRGLAQELAQRGLKVGFLKSSKEERADLEKEGTDTRLLRESGAWATAFWGKEEVFFSLPAPPKEEFNFWALIERFFFDCHLVLCEGFKGLRSVAKIEVLASGKKPLFPQIPGVIALVGEYPSSPLPCFSPQDFRGLADFILSRCPKPNRVSLLVDDKPVGLTRFVSKALAQTVAGFLESLRGVKRPQKIELKINLGQDEL